jgi:hypothetical protein
MSKRHQRELVEAITFKERRAHARGERQRVNLRLRELASVQGDGDEPGAGWRPERHHEVPSMPVGRRRVRHWKQPFWKRRTASRRERVEFERALAG